MTGDALHAIMAAAIAETEPVEAALVPLADVLDLLEKRAQIEAPNAAAALRWTAKVAVQKWGAGEQRADQPEP